ncbi:phosphodiesterase/alkaline phosphatase D [Tolypothrix sp. NIES-4075]|uniref:alkaline phosphatase D family protein n=1 Tax=Tolypothrix sp. NIES-4075 TaxID=2005459 RepID=UPI000B5CAC71|nr:alkaline phosphatase D family protein [Tolypothrix sp. NIES-4075]GAX45802.1 phosphodiesterase/alkaline phosphatase D [Tolypothrix sp. NIES-4075]
MQRFDYKRLLSTPTGRRRFLIGAGAMTGFAVATQFSRRVIAIPSFSDYPFKLGVASGDPLPRSVVLWTRLAPDPLNGGGMPEQNVFVQWLIAANESMSKVVRSGTAIAVPERGHSVHVDVQGLQPGRDYWYQFKVGNEVSPIGRTRTAPNRGSSLNKFRFAFASCCNYEQGYYAAYKHMAQEDLDVVVFLGDYIYEGASNKNALRPHEGNGEPVTLLGYRNRYAQYKSDPDLQAAHAAFPWIVTPDDHEVDNNRAGEIPQDPELQSTEAFVQRLAAAYQAYYEHMPLREFSQPQGSSIQLYRKLTFGDLVEFDVLDTRQFRTDQPCNDGVKPRCDQAFDPNATMTGTPQEKWLFHNLKNSSARWNIIAQQIVFTQVDWAAGLQTAYNLDAWDGYVAARQRILNFLKQNQPANPIVISGDSHASWVSDIKADYDNPDSDIVGTEFAGTSITSSFTASDIVEAALPDNPWIKYFNGRQRGYVRCSLTRQLCQADYRLLSPSPQSGPTVSDRDTPITTAVSFELPNRGVVEPT